METRNFFKKDPPHGLVKRFMFKRYIQGYIAKTQYTGFRTIILDGFSGSGRYDTYGDWPEQLERYGSPVIGVRAAIGFQIRKWEDAVNKKNGTKREGFEFRRKFTPKSCDDVEVSQIEPLETDTSDHYRINLILVENKKKIYLRLLQTIYKIFLFYDINVEIRRVDGEKVVIKTLERDEVFSVYCSLHCKRFEEVRLPQLHRDQRLLTFVDPFGYSYTPMRCIEKFLGPQKGVFINFMSSYVNRFVSKNPKAVADMYGIKIPKDIDNEDAVARFVSEEIRRGEGVDDLDKCVKNYENALREHARPKHMLTFEMRGKANSRLYHLIFMSDHEKGLELMKESMIRGTQEHETFALSDYKICVKGIELNLGIKQDDDTVASHIYKEFRGRSVLMEEICYHILTNTPFVFRKKQLNKLEMDKKITSVEYVFKYKSKQRKQGTLPDKRKQRKQGTLPDKRKQRKQGTLPDKRKQREQGTFPDWGEWRISFPRDLVEEQCDISDENNDITKLVTDQGEEAKPEGSDREEGIIADKIYKHFNGKKEVSAERIRDYLSSKGIAFKKKYLKLLEKDGRMEVANHKPLNRKRKRGTFAGDLQDWILTFSAVPSQS